MNRRLFRGAILETAILNLISDASEEGMHGYAIFLSMRKRFGVSLGPSTLYPELQRLETRGLIESAWDFAGGRARRKYRITQEGAGVLEEYSAELRVVLPALVSCSR